MFHSKTHNTVTFPLLHQLATHRGKEVDKPWVTTQHHTVREVGRVKRGERCDDTVLCKGCYVMRCQATCRSNNSLQPALIAWEQQQTMKKEGRERLIWQRVSSSAYTRNTSLQQVDWENVTIQVWKKYKPHLKRTIIFLRAILFPDNSKAKRAHHRRPLLPHSVWRSWRWETCARAMPCTDQAVLGNSLCQPEYRSNQIN